MNNCKTRLCNTPNNVITFFLPVQVFCANSLSVVRVLLNVIQMNDGDGNIMMNKIDDIPLMFVICYEKEFI